jgi:DNA-directed RNA polymerase subunit RPC12/RpoP
MDAKAFLAGIKGMVQGAGTVEPAEYVAANKLIRCAHCGGTRFFATRVSFHTAADSLVKLEWLAKEVHVLICGTCTRLDYFYAAPEQVERVASP